MIETAPTAGLIIAAASTAGSLACLGRGRGVLVAVAWGWDRNTHMAIFFMDSSYGNGSD